MGYNGMADDYFKGIAECADGGFIAVGSTKSFGAGNFDILLVRTDRNGNVTWAKTIGTSGDDGGNGIAVADDHGFMIAANTNFYHSNASDDALIIHTDSNGVVLWSKIYGDSLPQSAECIRRISGGNFLVVGSSYDSIMYVSQDAIQIKIDMLGNPGWIRITGSGSYEGYYSSAELPGGNLVSAGFTSNGVSGGLVEKTAPDGTYIWRKKFGGNADDYFYDIAVGRNGTIMAVGTTASFGAGGFDAYIAQTDSVGSQSSLVSSAAGTAGTEFAYSVFPTADTGFIVSGMTSGFSSDGSYDPFVMKINSAGTVDWTKVYGTNEADIISAGILSSDGHNVFAGYSYGLDFANYMAGFLIKTDASGDAACHTDTLSFSLVQSGIMQSFGMYDSLPPPVLQAVNLVSVPVSNLQLNPLCLNGMASFSPVNETELFPNPSDGNFTLAIGGAENTGLQAEIFDSGGRLVRTDTGLNTGSNRIDAADLPSGIYFLRVKNGDEIIARTKLIIARN